MHLPAVVGTSNELFMPGWSMSWPNAATNIAKTCRQTKTQTNKQTNKQNKQMHAKEQADRTIKRREKEIKAPCVWESEVGPNA
jgi:hypothetical protein